MLIVSLALMVIGAIIIFVGFKVKQRGKTSFIAGNNSVFIPKNETKLAKQIGFIIMFFGLITMLFPIVHHFFNNIEGTYFAILAGIHILAVFVFMLMDQMEN